MSKQGVAHIDATDEKGPHVLRRLGADRVGWLTTVAEDGTPQASPVWFLWDGATLLIYSLDSARTANIAGRSRVSFNLDGNGAGGDIVIIEGTASIDRGAPAVVDNRDYLAKYKPVMDGYGWTPEWFGERYRIPIRVEPTRFRYW